MTFSDDKFRQLGQRSLHCGSVVRFECLNFFFEAWVERVEQGVSRGGVYDFEVEVFGGELAGLDELNRHRGFTIRAEFHLSEGESGESMLIKILIPN